MRPNRYSESSGQTRRKIPASSASCWPFAIGEPAVASQNLSTANLFTAKDLSATASKNPKPEPPVREHAVALLAGNAACRESCARNQKSSPGNPGWFRPRGGAALSHAMVACGQTPAWSPWLRPVQQPACHSGRCNEGARHWEASERSDNDKTFNRSREYMKFCAACVRFWQRVHYRNQR